MSTKKYRPYFTAAELKEIIAALKESPTAARISISRYLEEFSLKISREIISPQLTIETKLTLEQKLEFAPQPQKLDYVEVRKEAYEKWSTNPSSCTPTELNNALTYRYENSLMPPEEMERYEEALFKIVEFNSTPN